jgi:predicted Rossmann fold nucleotide-binding protein DprA/Smf involved in DNA uptake
VGGFHTPVERDVLRILLRGRAPVLLVLGRSLAGWRAPVALRKAIDDGSLQVVSPFPATERCTTAETATARNRHVLTLCQEALFAHASRGGKTETLAREAAAQGIQLLTLPSKSNSNLLELGATAVSI